MFPVKTPVNIRASAASPAQRAGKNPYMDNTVRYGENWNVWQMP